MRLAFLLAMVAGCVPATGTILEVQGPMGTTSTAAGIATLELVVAYSSFCDRWVQDHSASRMKVSVAGRDLDKRPYDFFVEPSHQTNLAQPVYLAVLAWSATGELLGEATFGTHPFDKDKVYKHQARVALFDASVRRPGGPQYVASDGCVCVPGEPWLGTALPGSTCDSRVITSFARLGDTAGCDLTPKGAPLPVPVCDGQRYRDEPINRHLPCWANDASGACRMTQRRCADHDGQAWAEECITSSADPMWPQGSPLCSRYLACEQTACGDVTGCLLASFSTTVNVSCTVRLDSTGPGETIRPCPGTTWKTPLPTMAGQSCLAGVVQGIAQPPFTLGLGANGAAAATATVCPLVFQIDAIDAPYPMAVPTDKTVEIVVGDRLMRVTLTPEIGCNGTEPSLVCH
jgi:hypothetical protein